MTSSPKSSGIFSWRAAIVTRVTRASPLQGWMALEPSGTRGLCAGRTERNL
jgi:hypothetical protein